MRGWKVIGDECWTYALAETAGKAKRFWPGDDDYLDLRARREPWLDVLDGPARELVVVTVPHDCTVDDCGYCADPECWEGEIVSRVRTLARNR